MRLPEIGIRVGTPGDTNSRRTYLEALRLTCPHRTGRDQRVRMTWRMYGTDQMPGAFRIPDGSGNLVTQMRLPGVLDTRIDSQANGIR